MCNKLRRGIVLLFLLSLISTAAASPQTPVEDMKYYNARFGFSVGIPGGFIPQRPPDNGDGRVFLSEDGQAEIRVFASFNFLNKTISVIRAEMAEEAEGDVVLVGEGGTWLAASWLRNGSIYYRKVFLADGIISTLSFIYSQEQRDKYDTIAERLEKSFKPADRAKSIYRSE